MVGLGGVWGGCRIFFFFFFVCVFRSGGVGVGGGGWLIGVVSEIMWDEKSVYSCKYMNNYALVWGWGYGGFELCC